MISHIGPETMAKLRNVISSREYWTMNESLIQQYGVSDEGNFVVKLFSFKKIVISKWNKYRLIPVPEASVKLGVQVLLRMTGRQGCVGC